MSCIRFDLNNSEERRLALKNAPKLQHSAPAWTESKARRLESLAADDRPAFRERAALEYHLTDRLAVVLAFDPVESVRTALARNPHAGNAALTLLAIDQSENVRGFLAMNQNLPEAAERLLEHDESQLVRHLFTITH